MGINFITGDIHGTNDIHRLSSKIFPTGKDLSKDDNLIISGDFGLIWDQEQSNEEKYWLNWFQNKPWTTLFCCGNHENFERLSKLPIVEMFGGKVGKVNNSVYHLKRGEIYTINGQKIFVMGGGLSWDKKYRKEGISWWPEEQPSKEELDYAWSNLEKHNFTVDYVITHVAPYDIKDMLKMNKHDGGSKIDPLEYHLNDLRLKINFKKWYFGHMHDDDQPIEKYICLYYKILKLGDNLI